MPGWLATQIKPTFNRVVGTGTWFTWYRPQLHTSFDNALAALAMIAGLAASDDVGPLMLSSATTRNNVIDREIVSETAAVLADEAIADEDLATTELDAWSRSAYECSQSNDRWRGVGATGGVNTMRMLLQHIGFAAENEHESTPNVAHVQWFIVLIQNQYCIVHPAEPFGSGLRRFLRTRLRWQPFAMLLEQRIPKVIRNTKGIV